MAFPSMLVLALLFVATIPLAHGQNINATATVGVQVLGQVLCTATGNSVPGSNSAGAAGANVSLSCGGDQTILARATTNSSGFFIITVSSTPAFTSIINGLGNCTVAVDLPIANCADTPATGRLVANISPLDTVQTVLGVVLRFLAQAFSPVV